jgi:hypothetical protein
MNKYTIKAHNTHAKLHKYLAVTLYSFFKNADGNNFHNDELEEWSERTIKSGKCFSLDSRVLTTLAPAIRNMAWVIRHGK